MKTLFGILFITSISTWSLAGTPELMTLKQARRDHLLLAAPGPYYPYEMRHRGVTGRGIFGLVFRYETGNLQEVHVIKSTGSPTLDGCAIGALKAWKAKPNSIHRLEVFIEFMTRGRLGFS